MHSSTLIYMGLISYDDYHYIVETTVEAIVEAIVEARASRRAK